MSRAIHAFREEYLTACPWHGIISRMDDTPSTCALLFAEEAVHIAKLSRDAPQAAIHSRRLLLLEEFHAHGSWRRDTLLREAMGRFYWLTAASGVVMLLSDDEYDLFVQIGADIGAILPLFGINARCVPPS